MASPQKENGYTAIANELLEALIRYRFPPKSSMPFRVCLFVIRKTYGYQKKMDIISLSQFQKATNEKNRTNLIYWVRYLVQAKILVRIEKSKTRIEYGFNKNYEEWLTPVQATALVQARKYSSASNSTKSSALVMTHKRKKETNKRNIAETSSAQVPFNLEEKLLDMEKIENSYLDIIASFIREKPVKVENSKQLSEVISRYCRVAQKLSGAYSNKQIFEAVKKIKLDNASKTRKNQDPTDYTLETILKQLTK